MTPRKPRSEEELRKLSIRLLIIVVFLIYLLSPMGQQNFKTITGDLIAGFSHHPAAPHQ
jgi:hypothetical protein